MEFIGQLTRHFRNRQRRGIDLEVKWSKMRRNAPRLAHGPRNVLAGNETISAQEAHPRIRGIKIAITSAPLMPHF
jgi:hypothetical protein